MRTLWRTSALVCIADSPWTSPEVRKVRLTDSCTAAITGLFDYLIGAPRYGMSRKIAADGEEAARPNTTTWSRHSRRIDGRRQPPQHAIVVTVPVQIMGP